MTGDAALGAAWLRRLSGSLRPLELDPAQLAVLAARCPTLDALADALPALDALGPERWRAEAFRWLPAEFAAGLQVLCELHEWAILSVALDPTTELPDGREATALLRGAWDGEAGHFRWGPAR
jgi:hypothetical protein